MFEKRNKLAVMPQDVVLSYDGLLTFLQETQTYSRRTMDAVNTWIDAAETIRKKGHTIDGIDNKEADLLILNRATMMGIPTVFIVYMVCSALDAYLRGVCLRMLNMRLIADDSWFSLDVVERVTGVVLSAMPSWQPIAKVYDARTVLNRLEFTIEWSTEFVHSIPDLAASFATQFKELIEKTKQ